MRIATQIPVAINPRRISPGHVVPQRLPSSPSAAVAGPVKPTFKSTAATAAPSPFANIFQTLSQANAAAVTQPAASVPTPTPAPVAAVATPSVAVVADPPPATVQKPGILSLVSAIMDGSFKATNITDPARLKEVTPWMTDTMPNFYYASDQTANQMAQLLGGKVVQKPAFGQNQGWSEPNANFIELPNGQTFNVADVAYYARCGGQGVAQLTADITQTINAGAAWSNYYKSGGPMPSFATGYVGPPISGMDYPPGMISWDGTVINPAMQGIKPNT